MKFRLIAKLSETLGQSMVELALVLPLLFLLALGIFDFSRAIQANNIIINMGREGANLAARTSIGPRDIMNSLAATAQPLKMADNGMMYITEVKDVGGPHIESQIAWRDDTGDLNSKISQDNVAGRLGSITIPSGQSVFIFEIVYKYEWLFMKLDPIKLYSTTIF